MIHYTDPHVTWECKDLIQSEDSIWAQTNFTSPFDITGSLTAWQATVQAYSAMKLTFEKDRLVPVALAVIVAYELKLRPKDTYMAGMWRSTLNRIWLGTSAYYAICVLAVTNHPLQPSSSAPGTLPPFSTHHHFPTSR